MDLINSGNLAKAKDDTIDILNQMANQYMDVHKEEVAKSLFRTESVNEDHGGDKPTWNNIRYGMKNEPRSKAHGNRQLKHDDTDGDEEVEPSKEFIPYRFAIGNPKLLRKEETEQLDELSKKTLGNYLVKNKREDWRLRKTYNKAADDRYSDDPETKKKAEKNLDWADNKLRNREKGFIRAVRQLTKEEETSALSESKKTKTIKIKNLDAVDEILQGYDHDVDGNEVTMTVKDMSEFMKEVKDAGLKI